MRFRARIGFVNGFVPQPERFFWVNVRDNDGTWGVRLMTTIDPDPRTGAYSCSAETLVPNAAADTLVPGARVPVFLGLELVGHLTPDVTVTANDFAA